VSRVLHAEAVQQELRPAPRSLVCAEPSGRGLRRNVCRVARPWVDVGDAICRLAGAAEARIYGPVDAGPGPEEADVEVKTPGRSDLEAAQDARRELSQETRPLRPRPS